MLFHKTEATSKPTPYARIFSEINTIRKHVLSRESLIQHHGQPNSLHFSIHQARSFYKGNKVKLEAILCSFLPFLLQDRLGMEGLWERTRQSIREN